ncbi:Similar to Ankyrin repeat and KH domain-containing protein 1; acc. no. Q8IWZ3 [Pyronema omphalodes CBS 100304]|uniref:Similar to Ankyrin repeat and KH domain-containing protein 1 acc. no. Q8IWZ3 n=1 Tax=Pyronema omphalodes (strain CBS 100304) TaxID=1076935 RepID=U4LSK0_PYROM|nr:Similar to Ankyrin repeat and KH domain-containing protein 1; acc. no. Q8IWZ3 [Pyronema omphalodes CBS 100304]
MGFARLPNEILLEIGHICTIQSLSSLRAVNHYFYDLFSDIFYKNFAIPASKDMSPLEHASDHGDVEMLRLLLEKGANMNMVKQSWTPLHKAVEDGNRPVVEVLLEFGADIDALAYEDGMSPLMLACTMWPSHKEIIVILLENGADVEVGDWPGYADYDDDEQGIDKARTEKIDKEKEAAAKGQKTTEAKKTAKAPIMQRREEAK